MIKYKIKRNVFSITLIIINLQLLFSNRKVFFIVLIYVHKLNNCTIIVDRINVALLSIRDFLQKQQNILPNPHFELQCMFINVLWRILFFKTFLEMMMIFFLMVPF